MPSASANPDALDRFLRSSFSTGETPGLHTSRVKVTFKANRHNLLQLYLLSDPPILTEISRVANGQGDISEGTIDGVDKTIDNKVNVALVYTGGWCTYRKLLKNIQSSIRGLCTCK
jgi:hypothetical protein